MYSLIQKEEKECENFITRLSRETFFSLALGAYFIFRLTPRASFQIWVESFELQTVTL